jgi:chemotaxis response regulator CheB
VKRVLVVHSNLLLEAGVESLLLREMDLVVKGISPKSREMLFSDIDHFQPDVILIDHSLLRSDFLTSLICLSEFPEFRVIVINAENNLINVFDKRQFELTRGKDLLNALHSKG